MLEYLSKGQVRLPAVDIHIRTVPTTSHTLDMPADAVVDVTWQTKTHKFIVECKALSTPKLTAAAIGQAIYQSRATGLRPMIFVPYLSQEQLNHLEASGVSGIDLSGNGIINVPGEMLVYKTGEPNLYPIRQKRPNPYRGTSSLVARSFAIQTEFKSSRSIEAFIQQRGGSVTQGTISKALRQLEEDLVIRRQGHSILVLQYDLLLENLVRSYERPEANETRTFKIDGSAADIARTISNCAAELGEQVVITGIGSASYYTAMAQSPPLPIYCRRLDLLDGHADSQSRFPNVSIKKMPDTWAYYDARCADNWMWASPVQTYLELMNGGARDHEMADQVRHLFAPEAVSTHPVERRDKLQ